MSSVDYSPATYWNICTADNRLVTNCIFVSKKSYIYGYTCDSHMSAKTFHVSTTLHKWVYNIHLVSKFCFNTIFICFAEKCCTCICWIIWIIIIIAINVYIYVATGLLKQYNEYLATKLKGIKYCMQKWWKVF